MTSFEGFYPDSGYPPLQLAKQLQKYAPRLWELFFGKKYILPKYRADHYFQQDCLNFVEWSTLVALPFSKYRDEIQNACFCNVAGGLYHKRPTLFLERELGEVLLRTKLPLDMVAEDIKWKWPAMRIYLPKWLIPLRDKHYLTFLDIGCLENGEPMSIPKELAKELDLISAFLNRNNDFDNPFMGTHPTISFQNFSFHYPDRAIVLSGILNLIDGKNKTDLTTYAMVKPFSGYTISKLQGMTDHLKSAWQCDQDDDGVTTRMEHLALQILLWLSSYPLEYQPETVLRKPAQHGDRQISGLYAARFVGASQIRPDQAGKHHLAKMMTAEEYHQKLHWRCGYWRRQPCGPKSQERRLVWINPYRAGREEEED